MFMINKEILRGCLESTLGPIYVFYNRLLWFFINFMYCLPIATSIFSFDRRDTVYMLDKYLGGTDEYVSPVSLCV